MHNDRKYAHIPIRTSAVTDGGQALTCSIIAQDIYRGPTKASGMQPFLLSGHGRVVSRRTVPRGPGDTARPRTREEGSKRETSGGRGGRGGRNPNRNPYGCPANARI